MYSEFQQDTIFHTDRLIVRKLTMEDLKLFHEMQGDLQVMKFVAKSALSEEENLRDLKHIIDCYSKRNNDFWVWAIVSVTFNQMVGTVAIVRDKELNWEIGYRLLRKEWGKGYATEIVDGLIKFCEGIDGIDNLIAYTDLRNVASQRVLSKSGFVNLGIKYNDEAECEDYIFSTSTT